MRIEENSQDSPDITDNPTGNTDNNEKGDAEREENIFADDSLAMAGMTFRERARHKREVLKKRLATMDKKEGRKYIIYYYKWQFVAALVLLFLVSVTGRAIFKAVTPTPLKLVVVNFGSCEELTEYIPEHYREFYQLGKLNDFRIETNFRVSAQEQPYEYGQAMTDYQRISFYCDPDVLSPDVLDVIIGDDTALKLFEKTGDVTAVNYVLSDALYEKITDDMVIVSDTTGEKNEGQSYAIAIDITDTQFVKDCNLNTSRGVYLLIPRCKKKNDKHVENFVNFIYGYKVSQ